MFILRKVGLLNLGLCSGFLDLKEAIVWCYSLISGKGRKMLEEGNRKEAEPADILGATRKCLELMR